MNMCAYVTTAAETGGLPSQEMVRLLDPALKLLERFAWDDAGLDALRRYVRPGMGAR